MMKFNIENAIWKCIHKFGVNVPYKIVKNKKAPWVFISYIPEACYRQDPVFLNGHQNRREMKAIVDVFRNYGYNVYVQDYANEDLPSSFIPDIIFGIEPCFEAACRKWSNALRIYYATGAYWKHQNDMITKRTDRFNNQHGTCYPYQRLASQSDKCDVADYIFQIGTKFTIETYPERLRTKIRIIRQSNTLLDVAPKDKDYSNKKDFLWLGSSGTILKGLDLVVSCFKNHPELNLHVVGNADETFKRILETDKYKNIHFYGFVNTSSSEFKDIASKCNFLVYPSCTEGGCPGAVINSMYYGIIPIVTRWAAVDDIKSLGFLLKDLSVEAIDEALDWAQQLDAKQIGGISKECRQYILDNYSLSVFRKDMVNALENIIRK